MFFYEILISGSFALNPYCSRWNMLQKGVSVEHLVRSLILRVGYLLSQNQGIRANPYFPALDIDNVDMRLHLESAKGSWAIDIEVAVRSSSKPAIILGREDQYGTLNRWLKQSQTKRTPCLLFQYNWQTSQLFVFTPSSLRMLKSENNRLSVPLPKGPPHVEETLYQLLSSVAAAGSEAEARNLLL